MLLVGQTRLIPEFDGRSYRIETPYFGTKEEVVDAEYSDWKRAEEGPQYNFSSKDLEKNEYKKRYEVREKETWNEETEIKYNSWQDNTNFILSENEPVIDIHFKYEINFDLDTINYIDNLKSDLEKKAKEHDTQFEILELFEVDKFKDNIITLSKNNCWKNLLYFFLALIITLFGYSSFVVLFVTYGVKKIEIKIIKSVSISNIYKNGYMKKGNSIYTFYFSFFSNKNFDFQILIYHA